jgi:hypothetical protein
MRGVHRKAWVWGLALALAACLLATPAAAVPADGEAGWWEQLGDSMMTFVSRMLGSDTATDTGTVVFELDPATQSNDETPPEDPPPNNEGGPGWDPNG